MDRLQASLTHNLGPTIMAALADPDVIEIMVNPDQTLWIEKLGQDMALCGTLPPAQSRLIISLVASALETTVTADRPIVEGELPLGLRTQHHRNRPGAFGHDWQDHGSGEENRAFGVA